MLTLIQTSQDRKKELSRFVDSLNRQKGVDFTQIQLIFVDQGENKSVFDHLNPSIEFVYIKTNRCSLSHARNLALAYVSGEYVCFPDDDCWYEKDTLSIALEILERGNCDGVSGIGMDEQSQPMPRFPDRVSCITQTNRCAAISYTMFFRFEPSVLFDENMGVGSPYGLGSGEETDYMLCLMERHAFRMRYDPSIIVYHPLQIENSKDFLKKTYNYARGGGYLMQKHHFPLDYYLQQFIRPIGGMIIYMLKWDLYSVKRSFYILKGRIEGFYCKIKSD